MVCGCSCKAPSTTYQQAAAKVGRPRSQFLHSCHFLHWQWCVMGSFLMQFKALKQKKIYMLYYYYYFYLLLYYFFFFFAMVVTKSGLGRYFPRAKAGKNTTEVASSQYQPWHKGESRHGVGVEGGGRYCSRSGWPQLQWNQLHAAPTSAHFFLLSYSCARGSVKSVWLQWFSSLGVFCVW